MTFDPTKPVQTRGGSKARIICTDANNHQPIVALITEQDGYEYTSDYTKDGSYFITAEESQRDLINIPEQMIRWSNVYEDDVVGPFSSRQSADKCSAEHRIGVLKLTYENNELVDHEYEKTKVTR